MIVVFYDHLIKASFSVFIFTWTLFRWAGLHPTIHLRPGLFGPHADVGFFRVKIKTIGTGFVIA